METKTDKTAYWNHLARIKAEIKYSAAVTSLARRGSAEAKHKYNVLHEKGPRSHKDTGSHAKKLNDLWKQEDLWREHGEEGSQQRRHRLLAYGYLRGRTYKQMERTCASDHKPSLKQIAENAFYWGGPSKEILEQGIKLWLESGDVSSKKMGACFAEAARVSQAKNALQLAKQRVSNAKSTLSYKESAFKREQDNLQRCETALERASAEAEAANAALKAAESRLKKVDGWDLEHPLGEPKNAEAGVQ